MQTRPARLVASAAVRVLLTLAGCGDDARTTPCPSSPAVPGRRLRSTSGRTHGASQNDVISPNPQNKPAWSCRNTPAQPGLLLSRHDPAERPRRRLLWHCLSFCALLSRVRLEHGATKPQRGSAGSLHVLTCLSATAERRQPGSIWLYKQATKPSLHHALRDPIPPRTLTDSSSIRALTLHLSHLLNLENNIRAKMFLKLNSVPR